MVLETHMKLCMTAGLFDPLPPKKTKKQNNNKSNKKKNNNKSSEIGFCEFIEKFGL